MIPAGFSAKAFRSESSGFRSRLKESSNTRCLTPNPASSRPAVRANGCKYDSTCTSPAMGARAGFPLPAKSL